MALEIIKHANVEFLNAFHKEGKKIAGWLKGVSAHDSNFGRTWAFLIVDSEGNERKYVSGGNAKYVANNLAQHLGLIPSEPLRAAEVKRDSEMLGHYVEITPAGSYKNKRGQEILSYTFAVDKENKIPTNVSVDEIPF